MTEVTMGSKRNNKNTVKLGGAVNKATENTPLQEESTEKEVKSNRGASSQAKAEVKERPATKRRLGGNRPSSRDPFWYLTHEGELEDVTAESTNELLGIKEIKVYDPSDKQWDMGVLASVTLEMDFITIKGVQVRESTRDDSGSIYVQTQSRSWEKDGQKQYASDVELSRPVQAQILSYVESMLEEAQ